MEDDPSWNPIVENVTLYRVEIRLFPLTVSDQNPFRQIQGIEPGTVEAITVGYYLILKTSGLDPGTYRFNFGGRGRNNYQTHSLYEVQITKDNRRDLVKDVSRSPHKYLCTLVVKRDKVYIRKLVPH